VADLRSALQQGLTGAYTLEQELGGGGMSRVFVATETTLGRKVVIKVLPPELGAGFNLDRFRREIQLAASFNHPHIVPLYAAGQAGELPWYSMPLIEGESLRARLAREGELPVAEAVRLLRDIVDALVCAHEHGVVHRDIKPDNVLVSRNHAVVTDFGVAKALEASGQASITSTGLALGTPAYMAPEQAVGDPHVDHRVDIYAVGVLAYEMLTGHAPFTGPTSQAVLAAQVTQPAPPISTIRPSIPPGLAAVVMRCLEKRPADRWKTAQELLHQLESLSTPSGGLTPTAAEPVVRAPAPAAAAAGGGRRPWFLRPAAYLVLGMALVLALAWAVSRGRPRAPEPATKGARRIAVLPFENLGDSTRQYFASGVTEAITTQLTGIAGLSVIPRSTAARYRNSDKSLADIGRELGVGYVLEGTVQWEDQKGGAPRVRVSPELIRIADTSSVWAHGYDAVLSSVFQVYSDVATEVAKSLEVALADPERRVLALRPTDNASAYDLYLRATEYLGRGISAENFRIAIPMLERALTLDSSFALAWGRLAEAQALSHWLYLDRSDALVTAAKAAAERALRLQPELPEAHRAMGLYYYWGVRDYSRALAELAVAQRAQPNNPELVAAVGWVLRRQGRWEEAVAQFKREVELDPGSPRAEYDLAETLWLVRRFAEARPVAQRATEIAPDEPDSYVVLVALLLADQGDVAGARAVVTRAIGRVPPGQFRGGFTLPAWLLAPDSTLRRVFSSVSPGDYGADSSGYYGFRADLDRLAGQPEAARARYDSARVVLEGRLRRQPADYGYHAELGLVYARLGRYPDAIREGQRAVELLPPARDAYFGWDNVINLALIHALAGQAAPAAEQLSKALAVPSRISTGMLRLEPAWDPIRRDPAFKALLK
jgi:serine/threonine-protein kinase